MPQMNTSDSKANLNESATAQSSAQSGSAIATSGGGGTSMLNVGGSNAGPQLLSAANHLEIPTNNPNLLSPDILNQRRGNFFHFHLSFAAHTNQSCVKLIKFKGSRRPSILPVPDMFTSSSFSISGNDENDECDESEDELDDDVPWRSASEKIAYVH